MPERTAVRARGLGYDWHNVMHLVMGPATKAVYKTLAEKASVFPAVAEITGRPAIDVKQFAPAFTVQQRAGSS
jgi:hypothetical protein